MVGKCADCEKDLPVRLQGRQPIRCEDCNQKVRRERARAWNRANPERVKERLTAWRKDHPERLREYDQIRRARKKGAAVGVVDYAAVAARSRGICVLCNTCVPEGMRHFDHIIPLDKRGPHSTENLQLLCYKCNGSKGSRMPEDVTPTKFTEKPLPDQPHLLNPDWNLEK